MKNMKKLNQMNQISKSLHIYYAVKGGEKGIDDQDTDVMLQI